jgi:hypothetical protein
MPDYRCHVRASTAAFFRACAYALVLAILPLGVVACGGSASSQSANGGVGSGPQTGGSGGADATAPTVAITSPGPGATVSGAVTITATALDNVSVAGVQFKLDGVNLSSEDTSSPYSVSWNTLAAQAGTHSLTAVARDAVGNKSTSAVVTVVVANGVSPPLPPLSSQNVIKIYDASGTAQSGRPVSIARAFRQGDIPSFVQATIDGTSVLTQTDVKNRWPDGSLKFAVVSFVVPSLAANGNVTVSFSDQATGNNTGFLTQAQMLASAFDFDGTIEMTGSSKQTVTAREMLTNGHFRYWLQGPVVTAVILEDRTTARTYDKDFGDGSKALHPIFEAWFYPQGNKVELGYTVENVWSSSVASKSMRDLSYSLVLTSGSAAPTSEYAHPAFNHIGRSRWHKSFWLGTDPGAVRIDHNKGYLVTTKAIPKYDTNLNVAESLISSEYADWSSADKTLSGASRSVGNYSKSLGDAGSHPWIGLMNKWDTMYLLTMDNRMLEKSIGNADLIGRIPWHFREADTLAGSGRFFDNPQSGSVDTFGRVVSVNARKTVTLSQLNLDPVDCGPQYAVDGLKIGAISDDGWGFYDLGRHHMPDVAYVPYLMTGHYYYLEELQFEAAYAVAWKVGCLDENWQRHGDAGYFNDGETRGNAWSYRTVAYAAFISPDGSPEKVYFEDKLLNNIVKDEGRLGLTNSVPAKQTHWDWGKTNQQYVTGPSPLGLWQEGEVEFVKNAPIKQDGSVARALPLWQQYFVTCSLGMARDFGYPTDPILNYSAKQMFGQLLHPSTVPYLVELYQYASIVTATNDWIPSWDQVNRYYDDPLPTAWRTDDDIDHGYGFIALGALSFLYPYTADGFTGQQAWTFLKASKPGQNRFATESPKWAILP